MKTRPPHQASAVQAPGDALHHGCAGELPPKGPPPDESPPSERASNELLPDRGERGVADMA
ncbi:hypothetical protein [Streptomyces pristinaespiralis]|uniref:hypothetical protein n=1 Tax=Streptomyces pristinaespiralis TaxID=38300 RepID=UPI0001852281|nr:hypothetical protein [Streptomyces pristinaespiralis]